MQLLENKIPPPVIALLSCGLAVWISSWSITIEWNVYARCAVSLMVFSVGVFFCITGVVSFRRAKTTVNPLKPETASSLVDSGIYAISRNPMYVGFALIVLSLIVYLSAPLSLLGLLVFILYMNVFQIKPEERVLLDIFGTAFSDYQSRVRRWL